MVAPAVLRDVPIQLPARCEGAHGGSERKSLVVSSPFLNCKLFEMLFGTYNGRTMMETGNTGFKKTE
ncbi:hypothetical protein VULLAG_LOCUS7217 [Vulpes lagopus]